MTRIEERLAAAGMSAGEAQAKRAVFARARHLLGTGEDEAGTVAVFVPGRIEVLGKHTDYAGGRSLLCAIERGVCLVARPRTDATVRVGDVACDARVQVAMDPAAPPVPGWGGYVAAAARRLARNFPRARRGADIAFGSDLPMAAGMSSSSALVTSMVLALATVNDLPAGETWRAAMPGAEDLAEYLGCVENGQAFRALEGDAGVGTFGGSEDHTAMLCCRAGEMSQYRFCPVRRERQIPLPPGLILAVATSGVVAEKTGAAREAYNRASLAAREALALWNRATGRDDPSLGSAVDSSPGAADRIAAIAAERSPALRARVEQFVEETYVIVPRVAELLAAGRVAAIGDLVARSQEAAERGLRNQVPETSFLARSARELGAPGASAFGAGFGGSVWALVASDGASEFCARWAARYRSAFPDRAQQSQFFATSAGPPAIAAGAGPAGEARPRT